jgi:DNA-binding NtrC family response regulator
MDDDSHIRDTVRLVLSRAGYNVVTAANSEQARSIMLTEAAKHVSVVLCDLDVPNDNGLALIEFLRTHHPSVPVIVLSGASDELYLDAVVHPGVSDWIRKPSSPDEIVQKTRVAATLYRLRQQH